MSDNHSSIASTGMGFGAALAMIISWGLNHSIGWAIFHGMLGWFYVMYHWIIGVY